MIRLYGYWRSSSSYRLRLALALKGIAYEAVSVHLVKDGGQQFSKDYRALNPAARVPALELSDGRVLTQSMAIIEYLEETCPNPALLPRDPVLRAQTRALANEIASDAQPLHNSGVLAQLKSQFDADKESQTEWVRHWVMRGCAVVEEAARRAGSKGPFLLGDQPSLVDICIPPHLYTAARWGIDISAYPRLLHSADALLALPGLAAAHPDAQADAD
jgi:maleylacetoacetate isomerase